MSRRPPGCEIGEENGLTKVLIDCDPGHDDAVAILYAARHLDVVGITTVFGNASVENTTRNALSVCTLANLRIPVAKGFGRPLVGGMTRFAPDAHGATGIDGAELPEPSYEPVDQHAVHFIIEQARAHKGELVLVVIGAHTNVGVALRLEPRLAEWLKGISIMGGSPLVGNLQPVQCVNVLSDPEAAHITFSSDVPIHWVGYDMTRTVLVKEPDIARLKGGGRTARAVADLCAFYMARQRQVMGIDGAPMHDSCAVIPFVRPELVTYRDVPVEVELHGALTRGMTVVDFRSIRPGEHKAVQPPKPANAKLAVDADRRGIIDAVVEAVLTYP
jgi:inosine-uridine nucleoside N-ribohydrolase